MTDKTEEVEIEVVDHGIGIDPSRISKIFNLMEEVNHNRYKRTGLGIGLHLCKGEILCVVDCRNNSIFSAGGESRWKYKCTF